MQLFNFLAISTWLKNLQIYQPSQANGKDRAGRAGEEPGIRALRRPAICQGTWEISLLGPFFPQGVGDAEASLSMWRHQQSWELTVIVCLTPVREKWSISAAQFK